MTVYATMPAASNTFGKLGPVTALPVVIGETTISIKKGVANPEALTLSFDSKTGLVKGSFKLPVENGKIQSATFNGIVVLGWNSTNCGECGFGEEVRLPLVTGHWTFSDKWAYTDAKGKTKTATVKRGGAINIE